MFYLRLAATNIRAHKRIFIPFLVATTFLTVMNIVMLAAYTSAHAMFDASSAGTRAAAVEMFKYGSVVIAIFSLIMAWYANSFLLKQRTRQLALQSVIGFGKRELRRVVAGELGISLLITLIAGSAIGTAFARLTYLLLAKILQVPRGNSFGVSPLPVLLTAGVMLLIFCWLFILDSVWLARHKPIAMMRAASEGEREPKTRWLLTIIGLVALATGYAIAIIITKPLGAMQLFLVAVVLVIIGTYALFIAGSVFICKLLRRNKHYYYQPAHFINTANMIHRMRQNGSGLASIAILTTMTLVTIASTFTLYKGVDQLVALQTPTDLTYQVQGSNAADSVRYEHQAQQLVADLARKQHITITSSTAVTSYATLQTIIRGEKLRLAKDSDYSGLTGPNDAMSSTVVTTLAAYRKSHHYAGQLSAKQILFYTSAGQRPHKLHFGHSDYTTAAAKQLPYSDNANGMNSSLVVFANHAALKRALSEFPAANQGGLDGMSTTTMVYLKLSGSDRQQTRLAEALRQNKLVQSGQIIGVNTRAESRAQVLQWLSSFLFMGILLGLMFIMATALILYYKQVAEGLADAKRYAILQQVGLSRAEIKKTVSSQLLTLFYVPLVVAAVHTLVAAPFVQRIMVLFGITHWRTYMLNIAVTLGVFALLYVLMYRITSGVYYRIVAERRQ